MCDQTEIKYLDGDVVWVKLGSCWWPGEVVGAEKLPPDVLPSFRKPPIAVVKFFQETTYEYVKNINSIYKYNCSRKNEFINKGLYMYRTKPHMEKFPEDVIRAETAVGGDIEILTRDEFQEQKKESYAGLFGDKKTPISMKKGRGRGRPPSESPSTSTPTRMFFKEKSDYKVHILLQGKEATPLKESPDADPTPSTSSVEVEPEPGPSTSSAVDTPKPEPKVEPTPSTSSMSSSPSSPSTPSTPTSVAGQYACHCCSFSTTRLNVLIMHNKTHSVTYTPYTPSPIRPNKKVSKVKSPTKSTPKTPKTPRPRKEKTAATPKTTASKKRSAGDTPEAAAKKPKTEQEIKSSLLADWGDDEEESNDEAGSLITQSPELPVGSESPAAPISAELPTAPISAELPTAPTSAELPTAQVPQESSSSSENKPTEKPEPSVDSKYEFCEDEDWPEADVGRKIPRVKNPSKRKEDSKSLSLDDNDVEREVAELLNKTAVPELPSVPEPLKIEENFPEPSVVKSPDKNSNNTPETSQYTEKTPTESKPTKAIFKTKTFFRSRHSRSQDAIGKYVAEQLNPERLDPIDADLNGSDVVSSPEARESPPVDHVKVARLAPKIQLKKMKAEAAQLEKEKNEASKSSISEEIKTNFPELDYDNTPLTLPIKTMQDVIYPTQEIKPINKEQACQPKHKEENKERNDEQPIRNKPNISEIKIVQQISMDFDIDEPEPPKQIIEEIPASVSTLQKETVSSPDKTLNEVKYANEDNIVHKQNNLGSPEIKEKRVFRNKKLMNKVGSTTPILSPPKTQLSPIIEPSVSPRLLPKNALESSSTKAFNETVKILSPSKATVPSIDKPYEQIIPPMSESTASAVDALLSVSRETDRVPRIVGSGPPEDLFEDDITVHNGDSNMLTEENVYDQQIVQENVNYDQTIEQEKIDPPTQDLNGVSSNEPLQEGPYQNVENVVVMKTNIEHLHEEPYQNVETDVVMDQSNDVVLKEDIPVDSTPTESDLQIAETLLNLPSIQNKSTELQEEVSIPMCIDSDNQLVEETVIETSITDMGEEVIEEKVSDDITPESLLANNDNMNVCYESELEKTENFNAAQSLVQMSESFDHTMNVVENNTISDKDTPTSVIINTEANNVSDSVVASVEQKIQQFSNEIITEPSNGVKSPRFETTSSKLLKMLEEPAAPKPRHIKITTGKPPTPVKQLIVTGKEKKILNFDVAKASMKSKVQTDNTKQKIIIRRTGTGKSFMNNLGDVVASPDKIILSRSNVASQDGSSVQTFTIQGPEINSSTDTKQIIIQPKMRKITKTPTKVQKVKAQNSLVNWNETKTSAEVPVAEEQIFDINSMPVVLSDEILTPENIEKMPVVMSDGNNMMPKTTTIQSVQNAPKLIKAAAKPIIESDKVIMSASPSTSKPEIKTLLVNPVPEGNKVTTPNILSKSSKMRSGKPMLLIDKTTGKQKIIMTKGDGIKELKQAPTLLQQSAPKAEKFIILPTGGSPRQPGRAQKIVIDPQTGKAHVLVHKPDAPDTKPVSAKLLPPAAEPGAPANTVMIITNAQGAQSRIVLTPEHEKILFPNKQQPNVSQMKTITHRITTSTSVAQKTIVTSAGPAKPPARILPKQQKNAIITSKGQLIVGGRVATTSQNVVSSMQEIRQVPKAELRTVPKRIVASEPKKLVQAIQKTTSEPLIFLQQKSGTVIQLTAAQFEHLQRTGQIVQKHAPAAATESQKVVVQKAVTVTPKQQLVAMPAKQRVRKAASASPAPPKRARHEPAPAALSPAPAPPAAPLPPLASLSSARASIPPAVCTLTVGPGVGDLDNFEEMLPSTAIVRQQAEAPPAPMPAPPPEPEPEPEQATTTIADGHIMAVCGENFGLAAGTFYLCLQDNGTLTPIDNRPLVLENNQLVPMPEPAPERQDILQAALVNSEVFRPDSDAPDFRDLNANVSVHCRVSETSTTLHQPIMSPAELPSTSVAEPTVPTSLEAGLAVIGVTPHAVPTSLELPITVTDPRIAPRPAPPQEIEAPMSMPLLSDAGVGKSMPILTDDASDAGWSRRLLPTPHS